jgi:hypothetical protein
MAANSFLIKGWSVTLVAALFALASVDSRQEFAWLALLPSLTFWVLDGYYLRQEQLFRKLWDSVCAAPPGTLAGKMFSMSTKPFESQVDSKFAVMRSRTLLFFHGAIVLAVAIGIAVLVATSRGGQNANP